MKLSKREIDDLRCIFQNAVGYARSKSDPVKTSDYVALWEKMELAFQCENDTDGDGDCHLCFRKGGCELRKPL